MRSSQVAMPTHKSAISQSKECLSFRTRTHALTIVNVMMLAPFALCTAAAAAAAAATHSVEMPVVGAIRWDAYFSQPGMAVYEDHNAGVVARTTTVDMSPKKYHNRVPFFGKEVNDTSILVNGNTAETMGQEIAYAAEHGIKFWSFCTYPIGCKDYHPPDSDCVGIQCCAYVPCLV